MSAQAPSGPAVGLGLLWLALGAALVHTTGCAPNADAESPPTELVVFAASSLTEVFGALEHGFEAQHDGVDVRTVFAGSQVLRLQIEQGARADVFASADESHVRALVSAGLASEPRTFAHNRLVVIVPPANPAGITQFSDLARASRIVVGSEAVPVGIYTRELLERAKASLGEPFFDAFWAAVVSEETNARLVRAKVELGEADAALVYRTDATATDRVVVVPVPAALNTETAYPIATLVDADQPALAEHFVAYVVSAEGQRLLHDAGFEGVAP